jgi:hypothetical protein
MGIATNLFFDPVGVEDMQAFHGFHPWLLKEERPFGAENAAQIRDLICDTDII